MENRTLRVHGGSSRVRIAGGIAALFAFAAVIAFVLPAAAGAKRHVYADTHHTRFFWHQTSLRTATKVKARPALKLSVSRVKPYSLNRSALHRVLATAPKEFTRAARLHPAVVSLPGPDGTFQRFALARSAIMSPGLARKHPEIRTYSGVGIDDPSGPVTDGREPPE